MQEDNLYPASTEYFGLKSPKDQEAEALKEKDEVHSNLKLVNALIEHLEKRVSFYSSIDSISVDAELTPEQFMHNFAANQLVKKNLEAELNMLKSMVSTHQK